MSSDLLQEFGAPEENPWAPQHGDVVGENATDDDFGDFEAPGPDGVKNGLISTVNDPVSSGQRAFEDQKSSIHQPELDDIWDFEDEVQRARTFERKLDPQGQTNAPQTQFDNGWGDFTSGTVLFDAEAEPAPSKALRKKIRTKAKPLPPPINIDDDDFEAWEPENVSVNSIKTGSLSLKPASSVPAQVTKTPPLKPEDPEPPPSNVPPPSSLLSLSVNVLQSYFGTIKNGTNMSSEEQIDYIKQFLSTIRAVGRILAGRKFRWKRDTLLSQSMRIGQAGKQGGMKLTSIDKTETRREDQEAAELLQKWKRDAGTLRAGFASVGGLKIPELTDSMSIRTGKPGEGAITAPKPCFLCGLKRDERIPKVDFQVEDSFGEWWTEHWGHNECVNFWNLHKESLPHR